MKSLYIIIGKTTVESSNACRLLQNKLPGTAYPGCWGISSTEIKEETKENVLRSVSIAVNHFLKSPEYERIVFGITIDRQNLIREILTKIDTSVCEVNVTNVDEVEKIISKHKV